MRITMNRPMRESVGPDFSFDQAGQTVLPPEIEREVRTVYGELDGVVCSREYIHRSRSARKRPNRPFVMKKPKESLKPSHRPSDSLRRSLDKESPPGIEQNETYLEATLSKTSVTELLGGSELPFSDLVLLGIDCARVFAEDLLRSPVQGPFRIGIDANPSGTSGPSCFVRFHRIRPDQAPYVPDDPDAFSDVSFLKHSLRMIIDINEAEGGFRLEKESTERGAMSGEH